MNLKVLYLAFPLNVPFSYIYTFIMIIIINIINTRMHNWELKTNWETELVVRDGMRPLDQVLFAHLTDRYEGTHTYSYMHTLFIIMINISTVTH